MKLTARMLVVCLAVSAISRVSLAQTGPDLLVKPWPDKGQIFDGRADGYFYQATHTQDQGTTVQLSEYEAVGRFRILPGNEISPRIGYDFLLLENSANDKRIPKQLTDASVALGTGVAAYQGWLVGITLALGYDGSQAFDVGSAWYGKFDLVVARQMNETDFLGLILDVDTHRTFFPDLPLPGIGFSHRFDKTLQAVFGLPFSSVDWKPFEHAEVQLEYTMEQDLRFTLGYEFLPKVTAYGTIGFIRDMFHEDGLPKDRRLLYYQQRAEVGIKYAPIDNFSAKVAIGYAWDTTYRTGFDFRRSDLVAHLADTPFLHGGAEWKF